jgi:Fic family protein
VYLLREFSESPGKLMTINEVKNIFNTVYQTARTDLLGLVEIGFLEVKRSERRKLLFFRSENFEKLLDARIG